MILLHRLLTPPMWVAVALLWVVSVALTSPAYAQSDDSITANYTEAEVEIDGELDEFNGAGHWIELNAGENEAEARLLWDEEALYVGVAVSDSEINAFIGDRDGNIWREDSLEVFVDVLENGGENMQIDDYQFIVSALGTQFDSRGDFLGRTRWNGEWESATRKSGTFNENEDTDEGYTYELMIPWATLGVDADAVQEGYDVGFSVAINDWDQDGRDRIMWGGHTKSFRTPNQWGNLMLGSEDDGRLVCPIEEKDGRTIVDLTDNGTKTRADLLLRSDRDDQRELSAVEVEVPAGTYKVRMATYDWHSLQANPAQSDEVWEAALLNSDEDEIAVVGPTTDLPDGKDSMAELVEQQFELSEDAVSLMARHGASSGVNSVAPVCVSFDEVEADGDDDDDDEEDEPEDTDSSDDDADDEVPPPPMAITPTQSQPCHVYTADRSVPQGYGAAFSFASESRELLMQAFCDAQGVLAELGDGNASTYIYNVGYEWTGEEWNEVAYVGDDEVGESWYTRTAHAQLARSPAELESSNYFVAFICQWDGQWNCGCTDASCEESFWMLQNARLGSGSSVGDDDDDADNDDDDDDTSMTIYEVLAADDRFDTFVSALEGAGLDNSLDNENVALTVFAPTDEAFDKLDEGVLDALLASPVDELASILFYHIVDGMFDAEAIEGEDELVTLLNDMELVIDEDDDGRVTVGGSPLAETDISANNGVIHTLNDVLVPDTVDLDDLVEDEAATTTVEFDLTAENYEFSQEELVVNEGDVVRVTIEATDGTHDFVIDEFDVVSEVLSAGTATTTDTVEFVADEAGEYDFYCSIGNHRALGMEGTLIVN